MKSLAANWSGKGRDADLARFLDMVKAAKALVARFPDSAIAYDRLGDAYNWMNFWDEAADAYSRAVRIDPLDAYGWCWLGLVTFPESSTKRQSVHCSSL